MRILIVASYNSGQLSPFVIDQTESLRNLGIELDFLKIIGKGGFGYLKNRKSLLKKITDYMPDIIHAHGGHVGLLCSLQKRAPVVVTFHGSDVNNRKMRFISSIASLNTQFSIFVSNKLNVLMGIKNNCSEVIPCGVDPDVFYPMDTFCSKEALGFNPNEHYVLFASGFDNKIKNFALAKEVMSHFPELTIKEIKNRTREEVALLLNGAEALLMTSFSEGSPQITKEAMACGIGIVSVNVGDVAEQLHDVDNAIVCSDSVEELVSGLKCVLNKPKRNNTAKSIERYNATIIARRIITIYHKLIK